MLDFSENDILLNPDFYELYFVIKESAKIY